MTPAERPAFAARARLVSSPDRAAKIGGQRSRSGLFLWRLLRVFPSRLLEGAAEEELDLRGEAAQVVVRPPLDRLQQSRVDAKQEGFPFGHDAY